MRQPASGRITRRFQRQDQRRNFYPTALWFGLLPLLPWPHGYATTVTRANGQGKLIPPPPSAAGSSDDGRNQARTSFRQLTHPPLGCQSRLSCRYLLRTSHASQRPTERLGLATVPSRAACSPTGNVGA